MQKIWICGSNGRVGRKMVQLLKKKPVELLLTDRDSVDVTNYKDVIEYANLNRPHYIVNCSGMTDVTACESSREEAYRINALGARNLSVAARMGKAKMVQLSTDDVFDGNTSEPYTEFDRPDPTTVYGKSKLAGEEFVKEFSSRHVIVRSSWIFGDGASYLSRIFAMAKAGQEVKAASDQMASPTEASFLARKLLELMEEAPDGLYHVTGQGSCSREEFARTALQMAGFTTKVVGVPSDQDTLTNLRPSYSVLDNMMLRISGFDTLPDWREMLEEYLKGGLR